MLFYRLFLFLELDDLKYDEVLVFCIVVFNMLELFFDYLGLIIWLEREYLEGIILDGLDWIVDKVGKG